MSESVARDLELEARLLVKFCGWQWLREIRRNLCGLYPAHGDPLYERTPTPADPSKYWEPVDGVPPESERYHQWEGSCACLRGNWQQSGIPRLSASLDACGMLIQELMRKGFRVVTGRFRISNSILIRVTIDSSMGTGCIHESTFAEYSAASEAMSICRAADAIMPPHVVGHKYVSRADITFVKTSTVPSGEWCLDIYDRQGRSMPLGRYKTRQQVDEVLGRIQGKQAEEIEIVEIKDHPSLGEH